MHYVTRLIYALSLLALIIGPIHIENQRTARLPTLDEQPPAAAKNSFVPAGVYSSTDMQAVPQGIPTHGSWLNSDEPQGSHETGWFQAERKFTILVAGYPNLSGNRLQIHVRRRDGTQSTVPYDGPDAKEKWLPWVVTLPEDANAIRIQAVDGASGLCGWLGFSEPFAAEPTLARQAWPLLQLLATTSLALTLLYGPGLLWFGARTRPLHEIAWAIVIGPVLLAVLGLACWILGGAVNPITLARIGVAALLGAIGWLWWRRPSSMPVSAELKAVIGASALLVGFAVAKANLSFGPKGELYEGTVSRTLAVGGHSDSRISFHIVQLVAGHFAPFGPEADSYFSPWSFASRGPLAGLAASPVVLATGAAVPRAHPDQTWRPFDRQGFATYRVVLIVLAALAAWAIFGVATALASPAWGAVAGVVAMLAPFFVHELYFTWPKMVTAGLVLAAFLLAHLRRPFAAGSMLALGYLFHPLALLSGPFLGLWILARATPGPFYRRGIAGAWFVLGVALLVGAWQIVTLLRPSDGSSQEIFLRYFEMADNGWATATTWWQSRWRNFANTFVPFYLFTVDPAHESINSFYAPSDAWVRASFLYWNTLPFALGVPGFLLVMSGIASACRRAPVASLVTFIAPALFVIAYWGAASTGLMRHCGHVLFVSAITLAIWALAQRRVARRERMVAWFLHPACFAWRGFEIALVAFGTTLLHRRPQLQDEFGWNNVLSLSAAIACLTAAIVMLAKTARLIQPALLSSTSAPHAALHDAGAPASKP